MKRSSFVTWAELRVGIVVVICLALGILAIFTLGGRVGVFEKKYTLYTLMPSVSGLIQGAPVRLAGVDVGTVDRVAFMDPAERDSLSRRFLRAYGDSLGDRFLVVEFSVNEKVQRKLTRSSRAKIGTIGLLGDKYLDLEVGDPREPVLQEGDIVLNERPIDYEGLIARAAEGVDELVGSLEGSRQLIARVNQGEGTLGKLINDPQLYDEWVSLSAQGSSILERAQHGEGAFPALLNDPRLYDQLVQTTADLQQVTDQLRDGKGTLGQMFQDPALYQELVKTVREGQSLIVELRTGDGSMAKLINDPDLYDRLNEFVVESQALIDDLQKNPRKYINLKIF